MHYPSKSKAPKYPNVLRVAFCSLAAALVSSTASSAQTSYVVTELPVPAGYDLTVPWKINDQGYVAGYSAKPNNVGGFVATVWKNGVTLLGKLKNGLDSMATAINSKGVAVGEGDDGDGRPLGWIQSASSLVNFFSNNGGNTHPVSINDVTGEVGGYYIKGFSSTWRGAIWKIDPKDPRKSTIIDLPILPGSDPTTASAISSAFNKSNEAAGWIANRDIGQHAAFWKNDAAHTLVDLGVFEFDWSSLANSLNDLGQVVGTSHPPFGSRPVLWQNDANHTPVALPLLGNDNYGSADLINSRGTIIGSSATSEPGTWNVGASQIVIWLDGTPYPLQSLLLPSGAAWNVLLVTSINNVGQISALASRDGVQRAVILTPVTQ